MEKKIEKLNVILSEKSTLKGGRQTDILFPVFYLDRIQELEKILLERYGVRGKGRVITMAVMSLLEELKQKDGKES